jgi:hypothetical protein
MIVKPKPYSSKELGGYLLNGVEYDEVLFTSKIGYSDTSKIQNNLVYFVVNKMMEHHLKSIKNY